MNSPKFQNAKAILLAGPVFDYASDNGYSLRGLEVELADLRSDRLAQEAIADDAKYAELVRFARANRIYQPYPDA